MNRIQKRRIVLLTGNGRRHRWVAARLGIDFELTAVLCEAKMPSIEATRTLSPANAETIDRHFAERDKVEAQMFSATAMPVGIDVREAPHAAANQAETAAWIRKHEPEYVVLFGSSIIGPALLDEFRDRVVNIHLGLSPYYRGGATNFWPLYYGEPECVGGTLHLATPAVDGGPILTQVRPEVQASDRIHEIGTRALMAVVAALPATLEAYANLNITSTPQPVGVGRTFRRRDFHADAVRTVWRRLDEGMMHQYVAQMDRRRQAFPIRRLSHGAMFEPSLTTSRR